MLIAGEPNAVSLLKPLLYRPTICLALSACLVWGLCSVVLNRSKCMVAEDLVIMYSSKHGGLLSVQDVFAGSRSHICVLC